MGGPQLFHYPIPLRKSQVSGGSSTTNSSQGDTRRSMQPTKDLDNGNGGSMAPLNNARFRRSKKKSVPPELQDQPSLGSFAVSEPPTTGSTSSSAVTREGRPREVQTPHRKSPLEILGIKEFRDRPGSATRATSPSKPPREYGSSSSLQLFYDPRQTPLAISQQTSNSSARDFALRKGLPPVVSGRNAECQRPCACGKSHHPKSLPRGRKQRPARMDRSSVFPKSGCGSDPIGSTPLYEDSPAALSDLDMLPATPPSVGAPRNTRSGSVCGTRDVAAGRRMEQPMKFLADTSFANVKVNVRKPKAGTSHWFDDLEIDQSDQDSNDEPEFQLDFVTGIASALNKAMVPPRLSAPVADENHGGTHEERFLDPKTLVSPTSDSLRLALQNWETQSQQRQSKKHGGVGNTTRKDKIGVFEAADLQKESILYLSSEEDETDEDDREDRAQEKLGSARLRQRKSIEVESLTDSDVEFGIAQAVRAKKSIRISQPSKANKLKHESYLSDQSGTSTIATAKVPGTRSSKPQSDLNDLPLQGPGRESVTTRSRSHLLPIEDEINIDYRTAVPGSGLERKTPTKLITVTRQEESLLEAMRNKKASMRYDILAEAYRSALEASRHVSNDAYEYPPHAPRSSGDDDHPLAPHHRQGEVLRQRSSDNECLLFAEDLDVLSGTFSGVSVTDQRTEATSSSRRDSCMLSDIFTSPTTNRDSPATPMFASIPGDLLPRKESHGARLRPNTIAKDYHGHHEIPADQFDDFSSWNCHGWGNEAASELFAKC